MHHAETAATIADQAIRLAEQRLDAARARAMEADIRLVGARASWSAYCSTAYDVRVAITGQSPPEPPLPTFSPVETGIPCGDCAPGLPF